MGFSTVITSGKGGAGKSTVSVGLGYAFSRQGSRVLLVDCDAGLRSLDRMLGIEENLVFDISDVVCGRCAPAEAIYPCPGQEGLFLLPAPVSAEALVPVGVMRRLVPMLQQYFDHVILDSPAGVSAGFAAAVCAADRAVVISGADPVGVRSASSVRTLLEGYPVKEIRLVINRFNEAYFRTTGTYEDLDEVIDRSGIRLLGLVPEDLPMAARIVSGKRPPESTPGMMALSRIASRIQGERVPISPLG